MTHINFRILGKAVWDIIHIPLMVIGITVGIFAVFATIVRFFGIDVAVPVLMISGLLLMLSMFVMSRYEELMITYREEQKKMWDTLKK